VRVRRGNTAETLLDCGTGASRVTHVAGRAAQCGAESLREKIEAASGLQLRDDRFVDARGADAGSIEDVARRICAHGPLESVGEYDGNYHHNPDVPSDYSFSAYALDVAVDLETGAIHVRNALLVIDVGQIINPVTHQGQIEGAFVYGIGGALMEEIPIDEDGRPQTGSLNDYKLPTIMDIPPLRVVHVRAPVGHGPFGAKQAGELANSGVAPAIANAVAAAAGVRVYEMPLTSERVYAEIGGANAVV